MLGGQRGPRWAALGGVAAPRTRQSLHPAAPDSVPRLSWTLKDLGPSLPLQASVHVCGRLCACQSAHHGPSLPLLIWSRWPHPGGQPWDGVEAQPRIPPCLPGAGLTGTPIAPGLCVPEPPVGLCLPCWRDFLADTCLLYRGCSVLPVPVPETNSCPCRAQDEGAAPGKSSCAGLLVITLRGLPHAWSPPSPPCRTGAPGHRAEGPSPTGLLGAPTVTGHPARGEAAATVSWGPGLPMPLTHVRPPSSFGQPPSTPVPTGICVILGGC